MNPMQNIKVEKVTVNIGCGKDQTKLDKAVKLVKMIVGKDPVKTISDKRIPEWGLRPGLPIGCKITLRKQPAIELLKRVLHARNNMLTDNAFNESGTVSFGITEYIDIPGVKYDPEIGVMGLQVCATLERPGFRVKRRRRASSAIPAPHRITKEQAIEYVTKAFNIKVGAAE